VPVDQDLVGRQYSAADTFVVGREAVREFADAVGAVHPLHHDVAAAREAGHGDVVAPPTFAVTVAQPATDRMMADPSVGLEYSRIVHGEQVFAHHAPIVAGEELTALMTVASVRPAAGAVMLTLRTEVATVAGEPRSTVTALLVHR
jgi:acyl dehydratase